MKKTDKALENTLVKVLTQVCEESLKSIEGFKWLTHLVDYKDFPRSLTVICIFETQDQIAGLLHSPLHENLMNNIIDRLSGAGIQLPKKYKHIKFDSEDACHFEHAGNWNRRLK
jgi:hypothetical protein